MLVLAWLSAPLHFWAVRHHWCNEHARIEEGENHSIDTGSSDSEFAAISSRPSVVFIAGAPHVAETETDPHTACYVLAVIDHQKFELTTDFVQLICLEPLIESVVVTPINYYQSEPLLSLAPKHGPPKSIPFQIT